MVWKRQQNAYGQTPIATTPYQKAAQVWDERIGSARVQAKNWRLATLTSLGVSAVLAGGMLWQATQSLVTPYVVEIDTTGEVRSVTPTVKNYVPSDAQIAFQLADFIRKTRGISSDPVVVRQNWLDAYDFATSRAAVTLSDYAAAHNPFAEVGVRSVSIDIESVVRSSVSTFEVRWRETEFRTSVKQRTSSYTAQLSVMIDPPRDQATLQRNPLGLYVHSINWSQDRSTSTQTEGGTP